jgi:hypothetical protein
MTDQDEIITAFIERVNRLEARYKRDKYANDWLIPRDMMIALRDMVKEKIRDDGRHRSK